MPSDISRTSDEQRYDGVVMQQGRVILDRDFNALRQTIDARIDVDALDFVGPCGTPDDGFEVGSAAAAATSPPAPPPLEMAYISRYRPYPTSSDNFSISPGTMYVGGERAYFPPRPESPGPINYSYFDQPNWLAPEPPVFPLTQEFIYLHLLEHTVSAIEDPELKDVALGGPDTTQRLHLMERVKRLGVTSGDCTAARSQAVSAWQQQGLLFDPQTMRLLPQATLQVGYADPTTRSNPCDPVAQGGYLGADNQLIRVQISDGGIRGGAPMLLWGTDNASFLYRASISSQTSATLILGQSPVDAFHIPQQGQVIEVLRTAFIIDTEPNAADPAQPGIVRCVAETRGVICTLAAPYQPDTRTLSLNAALPAEYLADTNPLFVRIWQSQITAFTADGSTPYPLQYLDGSQTGVQVTIGVPAAGGAPPIGAYWMFAVRPSTPQAVYPERFLISPQPPDGPRQWICPLATIDWTTQSALSPPSSPLTSGPTFHDCRNLFSNLVELTKRKLGGCCAVTLRPEDLAANSLALQQAADGFLGAAQGMAVCLTPGTFALQQPLQLTAGHSGLTIEACHGAVIVQPGANTPGPPFLQGLFVLAGSSDVTLKGIEFIPQPVDLAAALPVTPGVPANNLQAALPDLGDIQSLIAIRLQDCTGFKLRDCSFQLKPILHVGHYGGAVFATGNCTGLSIRECEFVGPGHPARRVRPIFGVVDVAPNLAAMAAATSHVGAAAAAANAHAAAAAETAATTASHATSAAGRAKRTRAKAASTIASKSAPAPAAGVMGRLSSTAIAAATVNNRLSLLTVAQQLHDKAGLVNKGDTALHLPQNTTVATPQPPPSMLCAFLIAPSIDPFFNYTNPLTLIGGVAPNEASQPSQALLDQAEFVGNSIEGMTLAVLGAANTGALTVNDNRMVDCVGGIWYASLNQDNVTDAGLFQASLGILVQQGLGAAIAMSVAMWFPLPLAGTGAKAPPLSTQFQILNNRIDALPLDGSLSGPACMMSIAAAPVTASGAPAPSDTGTSVLFNSNQARNRSNVGVNTADSSWVFGSTVFLAGAFNSIVAANLIRNQSIPAAGTPAQAYSLLVVDSTGGTTNAVGNILAGIYNAGP